MLILKLRNWGWEKLCLSQGHSFVSKLTGEVASNDTIRSTDHPRRFKSNFWHNIPYNWCSDNPFTGSLLTERSLVSPLVQNAHRLKWGPHTLHSHYSFLSAWKIHLDENHFSYLNRVLILNTICTKTNTNKIIPSFLISLQKVYGTEEPSCSQLLGLRTPSHSLNVLRIQKSFCLWKSFISTGIYHIRNWNYYIKSFKNKMSLHININMFMKK